ASALCATEIAKEAAAVLSFTKSFSNSSYRSALARGRSTCHAQVMNRSARRKPPSLGSARRGGRQGGSIMFGKSVMTMADTAAIGAAVALAPAIASARGGGGHGGGGHGGGGHGGMAAHGGMVGHAMGGGFGGRGFGGRGFAMAGHGGARAVGLPCRRVSGGPLHPRFLRVAFPGPRLSPSQCYCRQWCRALVRRPAGARSPWGA